MSSVLLVGGHGSGKSRYGRTLASVYIDGACAGAEAGGDLRKALRATLRQAGDTDTVFIDDIDVLFPEQGGTGMAGAMCVLVGWVKAGGRLVAAAQDALHVAEFVRGVFSHIHDMTSVDAEAQDASEPPSAWSAFRDTRALRRLGIDGPCTGLLLLNIDHGVYDASSEHLDAEDTVVLDASTVTRGLVGESERTVREAVDSVPRGGTVVLDDLSVWCSDARTDARGLVGELVDAMERRQSDALFWLATRRHADSSTALPSLDKRLLGYGRIELVTASSSSD